MTLDLTACAGFNDTIRDAIFNVRSKADITQLNSTENYGRMCLTPLSPHRNYILS